MKKIISILALSFLLLPSSFVLAEIKIRGPYSSPFVPAEMQTEQEVDNQGPRYKKDSDKKEYYLKINDKEYGPYIYIGASLTKEKLWGFEYQDGSGAYTNVNGKIYGPYDTTFGLCISGDNWGFKYSKDKKAFVVVNDTEYGPYDFANVSVSDKIWAFNNLINRKTYVNSMGRVYGPYDRSFQVIETIGSNWKINYLPSGIFSHSHQIKYSIVNGFQFGPYDDVKVLMGEDDWVVNYRKDKDWFAILSADNIGADFSELETHNFTKILIITLILLLIVLVVLFFVLKILKNKRKLI